MVEAEGEEAGVQALDAEEVLLGEGDALDGEGLLGIDGLVGGDGVGTEAFNLVDILEADDGESVV